MGFLFFLRKPVSLPESILETSRGSLSFKNHTLLIDLLFLYKNLLKKANFLRYYLAKSLLKSLPYLLQLNSKIIFRRDNKSNLSFDIIQCHNLSMSNWAPDAIEGIGMSQME